MKKKYLPILSILIITIISACGPAPTPTLTAEEISNTAIANAWISSAVATQDPCNLPSVEKPKGELVKVKFVNKSEGVVYLAFGMNTPNDEKECVTYSYTLGAFDETVATVLAGCYWGYAWITGDKSFVARTGSTILCVTDPNKTPAIWITKETINFH